jgi:peptide deformylase
MGKKRIKITTVPDPILRKKALEVSAKNPQTKETVTKLWNALENSLIEGVGIAAPQISVSERIFILRDAGDGYQEYLNPRIVWESAEKGTSQDAKGHAFLEGCLSIPGLYGPVIRPLEIEVEYELLSGETRREKLKEPYARYFQHELDHLNGILFIDRVIQQKGKLYEVNENDELVEIRLPEIVGV